MTPEQSQSDASELDLDAIVAECDEHSERSIGWIYPLVDKIEAQATTIKRLETSLRLANTVHADHESRLNVALRKLAIQQHARVAYGGGTFPSGGHCELCQTEWEYGDADKHTPDCLAALAPEEKS